MGKAYASGKDAWGLCQRCGFRYKLKTLKHETVNKKEKNLLVCETCYDKDHPQNELGRTDFSDSQGLKDPSVDTAIAETRNMFNWNPAGGARLSITIGNGVTAS